MARYLPKWRGFTWVVVIINVLFLVGFGVQVVYWLVNCTGQTMKHDLKRLTFCQGQGTGMSVIFIVWASIDILFGVIWLVTRSRQRVSTR